MRKDGTMTEDVKLELVRRLEEVLDVEHAISSADPPAWIDLIVDEIKKNKVLADAARELIENPPNFTGESSAIYDSGRNAGVQACVDMVKGEAPSVCTRH